MNLYQTFSDAIQAEKNAGIAFIFLGVFFLTMSGYLFVFANPNIFIAGAKWPGLIAGLFIVIGGLFYVRKIDQNFQSQTPMAIHQKKEFVRSEIARATKLYNGYKQYSIVWLGLTVISIALIIVFKRSVYGGIGYVALLFTVFTIFNEIYAAVHTGRYLEKLRAYEKL